jgi:hypothetical protein
MLPAAFLAAAIAAPLDQRLLGAWQCTAAPSASAPVRTFSLLADGTYSAGSARGHYRFDERSGRIVWVNGALRAGASNTRYRIDENSKPTIEAKLDRFDYRCSHAGAKPAE